jgi:hypothetical protein
MKKMCRNVLIAGAFAFCNTAAMTAAKADVLRIVVVVANNTADYSNNVALLPTVAALLKKGTGVKAVYAGTDAANMSTTTTSVWADEAGINSVISTTDWKATMAKVKSKPITPEVFQLVP